jgi:nitrogen fixation/metabolism regulation signal transduction histidine kinase
MDLWLEHFARASFRRSADTAHDLKTPLNVAVLNLELLRMRLRKIADEGDEKLSDYTRAIELELRRMGRIFDAFFLLSTPPAGEGDPQTIDVAPIVSELASAVSLEANSDAPASVLAHEPRIRQAVKLFFEGAAKQVANAACSAGISDDGRTFDLTVEGKPFAVDFEPTRIFKFYYTDAEGNPDLSLAVARLIAETYGGEVSAVEDRDKVSLRLSFPLGAR